MLSSLSLMSQMNRGDWRTRKPSAYAYPEDFPLMARVRTTKKRKIFIIDDVFYIESSYTADDYVDVDFCRGIFFCILKLFVR